MAAVQKGTTLKISFGSLSYTGYTPQDAEISFPNDNVEINRDGDGATFNKILMDPQQRASFTFLIQDSSGSITPPEQGDTVTLTPPQGTSTAYYCESASVAFAAGASRLSLEVIKEDSMTYT